MHLACRYEDAFRWMKHFSASLYVVWWQLSFCITFTVCWAGCV